MKNYNTTLVACCSCSVTQAITMNLAPLLFVVFTDDYGVSLSKIALLISLNFFIQIFVDLTAPLYVDRIGYRACVLAGAGLSLVGLFCLGLLPLLLKDMYSALIISTVICAVGGGILEVTTSPIVDTIPGESKRKIISLLHSFYCWGHATVILLSTVYLSFVGLDRWFFLPLLWCAIPLFAFILFTFAPIGTLDGAHTGESGIRSLLKSRSFWLLMAVMVCAGAAEQGMAQWSSLFIQKALNIPKALGDLFGPFIFAICMGAGRILLSVFGKKINLARTIMLSFGIAAACYLVAAVSPSPILSLIACAASGIGTAILWPGTLTLGDECLSGSTAMFAYFALGGDIGCTLGPDMVGVVSDAIIERGITAFGLDSTALGMKMGMLLSSVFPIAAVLILIIFARSSEKRRSPKAHNAE